MIYNGELAVRMAGRAAELVTERFTPDVYARFIAGLYGKLFPRGPGNSLELADGDGTPVEVLGVSAARGEGIDVLLAAIDRRWEWLAVKGRLALHRQGQARRWLAESLRERFGRKGLERAGELTLAPDESPFARLAKMARTLS